MTRKRQFLAMIGCVGFAASAVAQKADRVAEGVVRRPGPKAPVVVPGSWVVLHRVGTDRAAPLDSVRSSGNGTFRFRYATSGSPDAIYFVSTTFRGIAYFSAPPASQATARTMGAVVAVAWYLLTFRIVQRVTFEWLKSRRP